MPFSRSSLQDIIDRITSDFQTRITGATTLFRRSVLRVIARVMAGAVHLIYEYLDYQAKQLFISTADEAGLESHASEYGLSRTYSIKASGTCTATGTNGIIIPSGTQLVSDGNITYETDSDVTIAAATASLDFTAIEGGEDGNDEAGITLTFVSPITGVDSEATVDSNGITGGSDEEDDDTLRERLLTRKRQPPHGGAYFDYEVWAKEYSGDFVVTRAWAIPQYMGIGTIGVGFVMDNESSIIPNSTQRAAVRAYIVEHEDPASGKIVGCPVTAEPGLFIVELTPLAIDFSISIYPNTAEIQDDVEDALAALIEENGGPEETIYLSQVSEAISLVTNEERHTITSPVADITASSNQIHVLGTVTFMDY